MLFHHFWLQGCVCGLLFLQIKVFEIEEYRSKYYTENQADYESWQYWTSRLWFNLTWTTNASYNSFYLHFYTFSDIMSIIRLNFKILRYKGDKMYHRSLSYLHKPKLLSLFNCHKLCEFSFPTWYYLHLSIIVYMIAIICIKITCILQVNCFQ